MAKYPDWPKNVKLELSPCGYIEAVKYHIGQNGKKYVIENFDRGVITKKYIDFFLKLENKRGE